MTRIQIHFFPVRIQDQDPDPHQIEWILSTVFSLFLISVKTNKHIELKKLSKRGGFFREHTAISLYKTMKPWDTLYPKIKPLKTIYFPQFMKLKTWKKTYQTSKGKRGFFKKIYTP